MKRITKTQKEIFNTYLDAFKNKAFNRKTFNVKVEAKDEGYKLIRDALLKRETIESLWNYLWKNNVSITSQLMYSGLGSISGKAELDMKLAFKNFLNRDKINIK